jgi:alanyl-tRNA synthetase
MTEKYYFESDVLENSCLVTNCYEEDGKIVAILDRTIFHPQGGGQPSDTGWIGASRVLHVLQDDLKILHFVESAVTIGLNNTIVDSARRNHNARLHTAGHLIGNIGSLFGYSPIKAHHWPGESKVTFKADSSQSTIAITDFVNMLAKLIAEDLPRYVEMAQGVRAIGFGNLPSFPCGGTHVARLSDIGQIRISSVNSKKGILSVHYEII